MPNNHLPFNSEKARINLTGLGTGWVDLSTQQIQLNDNLINSIDDDDISGSILTSSIPDPLARILIFKNAFEYFNELNANVTNYDIEHEDHIAHHKLLSDCFDLLQMIYEQKNNGLSLIFKPWNINERVTALINSNNPKHKHLGNTLDFFFRRNSFPDGFVINLIFVIVTKTDGTQKELLVGGTSPFTLVYTAPDWRTIMQDAIRNTDYQFEKITSENGNDTFFDDNYFPLKDRVDEFQAYLYQLLNPQPTQPNN